MDRESNSTPESMPPPTSGYSARKDIEDIERTEELRSTALGIEEPGFDESGLHEREMPQQGEARAQAGLKSFIIQRPLVAVVGALAAGFIVGRILSRR